MYINLNHAKKCLKVIPLFSILILAFQNCGEPLPESLKQQQESASEGTSEEPAVAEFQKIAPRPLFGQDIHIVTQPANVTTIDGARNVSFRVVALADSNSLSYQWKKDGMAISGQVSSVLNLDPVSLASRGSYSVVISNGSFSLESAAALLEVLSADTNEKSPRSNTKYSRQIVQIGEHVILKAKIQALPHAQFQWFKNDDILVGATSEILTLVNAKVSDSGKYSVRAVNSRGSVKANVAELTVRSENRPPAMQVGLSKRVGRSGENVELSGSFDLGVPYAEIRWYKNNIEIPNSRNVNRLLLSGLTLSDEATYRVEVSNGVGTKIKSEAKVLLASWGAYANSGSCSKTCGGGTLAQTRSCATSEGTVEAILCEGGALAASRSIACNEQACAAWGEYQDVGSCSQSCGGGIVNQVRQCLSSGTVVSAEMCPGGSAASTRIAACNTGACGSWGEFQDSTSCSVVCGGGIKTQTRRCVLNSVYVGVEYCNGGAAAESRVVACNTGTCNCPAQAVDVGLDRVSDCYENYACLVRTNGNVQATDNGQTYTFSTTGTMEQWGHPALNYVKELSVTYKCENTQWKFVRTNVTQFPQESEPRDGGD